MSAGKPRLHTFVMLYVIATLIAGWQLVLAGPEGWPWAALGLYWFPLGLLYLFNVFDYGFLDVNGRFRLVLMSLYLVYGLLVFFGAKYRSKLILGIFVAMLVLNVAGCQILYAKLSKIGQ